MDKKIKAEQIRIFLMLSVLLSCMLVFAVVQPYGDGPDEINRFKIVEYIYEHGALPVGDAPEVLIDGYGGSYAFQPILTYMIDGYLLRALRVFEPSLEMRVFLSRLVNVFFGCIMVFYVKKLSDLLFCNKKTSWAFTLAIVFLPQNLFIHTYVNTDSMGLLSIVIVLHALVLGMKDDFSRRTCIELAVGVIACALSYYNCYGIIVCAVLFFILYFHKKFRTAAASGVQVNVSAGRPASSHSNGMAGKHAPSHSNGMATSSAIPTYDLHALVKKGLFISAIVLLAIGWWFIRNAVLYDGDFLGMEARNICAAETGLEAYNPYTRDTYERLGIPLVDMIFGTDYFTLVWKSFIAMFGPMLIPTHHYIYMSFKNLFFIAVAGLLLIPFQALIRNYVSVWSRSASGSATASAVGSTSAKEPVPGTAAGSAEEPVPGTASVSVKSSVLTWASRPQKWLVHMTMLLGIIIPVILALYYSYTFDFQPQGRYYLPIVVPFMYFLAIGIENLIGLIGVLVSAILKKRSVSLLLSSVLYHLLYAFLTLCLLYATFVSMLGYYRANGIMLFS